MNLVYRYKHLRYSQAHPYNSIWSKLLDWSYNINRNRMMNETLDRGRDRMLLEPATSVDIKLIFDADIITPDELDNLILNNYEEIELKRNGTTAVVKNPIVTSREVRHTRHGMNHMIINILADSIEFSMIY